MLKFGFAKCVNSGKIYHIIFLDVEMPEINGFELGDKIKNVLSFVMVLLISSHRRYISEAFYINAATFLAKPVDMQRFCKEFGSLYEKHSMLIKTITIPRDRESRIVPLEILYA